MDITNKEFKRSIRGYDAEEVDEFLDKLAEDYETLYKENSSLKEKITMLNDKLEHFAKMEETIQNTLVLAQNAADQAKSVAQREADLIMKNASESAQRILDKAHHDVLKITEDYDKAKHEFNKFTMKYRNFITSQLETFNFMEKDFSRDYGIGSTLKEELNEKGIEVARENASSIPKKTEEEFKVKSINLNDFDHNLDEVKTFYANK